MAPLELRQTTKASSSHEAPPPVASVSYPRNNCSFSMVSVDRQHTELSSFDASSTMSLLGEAFLRRMASEGSVSLACCDPSAGFMLSKTREGREGSGSGSGSERRQKH